MLYPIKQNEEILQLFPHFTLFSYFFLLFFLQNYYISSDFATFFAEKVINSSTKLSKTKSQSAHNKSLIYFINTKSFPFLKICQLHLITYKVQQTHRSDKTVGFVFFVSSSPSLPGRTLGRLIPRLITHSS